MPIEVKVDLLGSSFTRGVFSGLADRAERKAFIKGMDNPSSGNTDLVDAANTLIAHPDVGLFHPQDETLPLQTVRVYKIGGTRGIGLLRYRRVRGGQTGSPDVTQARYRTAFEYVECYRDTSGSFDPVSGLPGGAITNLADITDPTVPPRPWRWARPTVRIQIQGISAGHPFTSNIGSLLRKVNQAPVSLGSIVFPAFSLRFDSVNVDVIETSTGTTYPTAYVFTAVRGRWSQQFVRYDGDIGEWTAYEEIAYESGDFLLIPPLGGP